MIASDFNKRLQDLNNFESSLAVSVKYFKDKYNEGDRTEYVLQNLDCLEYLSYLFVKYLKMNYGSETTMGSIELN